MTASIARAGHSRIDIVVGARLITALEARALSKDDLAAFLAEPLDAIERYCRGEARVGPGRLLKICGLLDISVGWFFAE